MKRIFIAFMLLCGISKSHAENNKENTESQEPAQRIIALAPHLVELIYEIGAQDSLVGVSAYSDFPDAAESLPVIGDYFSLDVEKILTLQPDLILAWRGGNPEKHILQLQSLGFRVEYSQPKNLEDVAEEMIKLGKLLGTPETALITASRYKSRLKSIANKYQNERWINGFYEIWPNPLTTINDMAWPARHLSVCRIRNNFADSSVEYPQITVEQVLAKKVDIIIQPMSVTNTSQGFDWLAWQDILKIEKENIIQPDADLLFRMTSRGLVALQALCESANRVRVLSEN